LRVIISGYYGFHNAGDEAVLAGLIAGLVAQPFPNPDSSGPPVARSQTTATAGNGLAAVSGSGNPMDITVLSGAPAATANLHGVRAIGRGLGALRRELRDADLFISGGGNLFQDATSARSCLYYLYVMRQALLARVPVVVLGQGIGPLRRWWVRALVRRCLNRVQGIALRDSESARELERLGVSRPPIRVGADLSFAMSLPPAEEVAAAWRGIGVEDPGSVLAIAPRTWHISGAGEGVVASLAAAVKCATAQFGDVAQPPPAVSPPLQRRRIGQARAPVPHLGAPRPQVVVFPMQRPQDDPACAALADAVGGIFAQPELPPALLAAMIGSARVVVGVRLHALIFAAMGGAMPVAISYDPKVEAFMTDLGLNVAATTADLAGSDVEVSESRSSHPSPSQGYFARRSWATKPAKAGEGRVRVHTRDAHPPPGREGGPTSPWQGEELPEARLAEAIIAAWNAGDETRAALRRAAEERRRVVADTFAWAVEIARGAWPPRP